MWYAWLDIIDWEKKEPVSIELQQFFERGNAHEPLVIQYLARLDADYFAHSQAPVEG